MCVTQKNSPALGMGVGAGDTVVGSGDGSGDGCCVGESVGLVVGSGDGGGVGVAVGDGTGIGVGSGDGISVGAVVSNETAAGSTLTPSNVETPASAAKDEIDESSAPVATAVATSALTLPNTSPSCCQARHSN